MSKVILSAKPLRISDYFRDVWEYRDLLFLLTYRDIKAKFVYSYLGFIWIILQPLLATVIFTLLFHTAFQLQSEKVPYAVYAWCGVCTWSFVAYNIGQSGNALLSSRDLVKKVYFPRMIIPISKMLTGLVDWLATLLLLMLYVLVALPWEIHLLSLPLFIFAGVCIGTGIGIGLNALMIRFRDIQLIIPYMIQIGLYVTPAAYGLQHLPQHLRKWFYLNPITGLLEGLRYACFGIQPDWSYTLLSIGIGIGIFFFAAAYFIYKEPLFAEEL